MTIAIFEIAPKGHYTYVESIAKIYTAVAENKVVIYTTDNGKKAMQHIENQSISIIVTAAQAEDLERIAAQNFDKIFVVTLEPYAKEQHRIMTVFEKINFNAPIYYVIHNVDLWFEQSLVSKIRNVFFKLNNFGDFIYRLKIYFWYVLINKKIIQKVEKSGGSFVTLTETVATHLRKYTPSVSAIPFSVFDEKVIDNSLNNSKIRICLPGYVSTIRRNYGAIFDILESNEGLKIKEKIEWDFLGGIYKAENGESVLERANILKNKGFSIQIYDKPNVGLQEFDENLAKADLVLGNLHLQQGANSSYGKTKESGLIFTMIKAAKPGIVPSEYPLEKTIESSILTFKNYQDLAKILIHLTQHPEILKDLKAKALVNSLKYTPLSIYQKLEQN